jgi:uncharacterized protein YicC (UPF0701 family)
MERDAPRPKSMTVYSMTGYASVLATIPAPSGSAPSLALELRSVNGRFLDLSLKLPDELRTLEPQLRELVSAGLRRGKVELRAALQREGDDAGVPLPTPELLEQLARADDLVRARLHDARPLSVHEVLQWARAGTSIAAGTASGPAESAASASEPDTAAPAPPPTPTPALDRAVLEAARGAVHALQAARAREGAKLVAMLLGRIAALRELATRAGPLVPEAVARQRERFLERWREALQAAGADSASAGAADSAAHDRAMAEAAAYALRIDVAEELTRLDAHLDEIERLLHAGGELGKRLDFLIQELHREANTLGSKSASTALSAISVDMRVLVEQMREQVQNIE